MKSNLSQVRRSDRTRFAMRRYSARRLSQRSKKVLPWRNGNAGDLQRERQNECGGVIVQTGKINPQDIPLGSYILVSGFDDAKPHVAQLLSLNDDGSTASVCWFARPSELPKRLLDKIHRPLHSQELFLCMEGERRRSLWSSKIDTDTILGPAQVKLLKADDPDPAADLDNVFVVHLSWDGRTVSPLTAEQLSSQQLDPQAVVTTPSAEPSVPRNGTNGMNQRRSAKDCKSQVHVCRLTTEEIISLIFEEESTVTNESSKRGKVSSGHSTKTATRSPSVRKCNDRRDEPLPSPHTLKIRRTTRENTKNVSIAQDCKTPIHKNDSPWCLRSASRLLAKSNGTAKTQSTVSDTSKRKKILEESDYEDIAETDEDSEEEEENEIDDDDDEEEEPEAERPKRSHRHVPRRRVSQGKGRTISSPSMPCRSRPAVSSPGVLEDARGRLCVSAVPDSLPCREEEFHHLYSFISSKLDDGTGGCMYVSGVPGTGKTATLCEVVRVLREGVCQGCVPEFRFVELNGLRLTEPRHAFSHVLKVLTGRKATPDHAASLLDEMFSQCGTHHEATLLLVDEVDSLCSRPAVIYRLLDWPSHRGSRLILVAIANTLDLPERLQGRLASRLGVTRLAFPPYSHKQLVQVLGARLEGLQAFQPDALALVARKVAALSGDARRALDICRRAAEIALNTSPRRQQRVEMAHMSRALDEMFSSPCILAVRQASWLQRAFLQALLAEFSHSGVEEATLLEVYPRLVSLCRLEGIAPPSMSRTYASCAALYACRLVLADTACKPWRLRLSGSRDDITFALRGAEGLKS